MRTERRLIVDGYNVLAADPNYAALAKADFEMARRRLIEDVAAFSAGHFEATVVFDGAANPESNGSPERIAGITVVFSRFGQEADAVVEAMAFAAREAGESALVVTSDRQMRWTVFSPQISVVPASRFLDEMSEVSQEWAEHVPAGRVPNRLEDRLPTEIRETLLRWLRGEQRTFSDE